MSELDGGALVSFDRDAEALAPCDGEALEGAVAELEGAVADLPEAAPAPLTSPWAPIDELAVPRAVVSAAPVP